MGQWGSPKWLSFASGGDWKKVRNGSRLTVSLDLELAGHERLLAAVEYEEAMVKTRHRQGDTGGAVGEIKRESDVSDRAPNPNNTKPQGRVGSGRT